MFSAFIWSGAKATFFLPSVVIAWAVMYISLRTFLVWAAGTLRTAPAFFTWSPTSCDTVASAA